LWIIFYGGFLTFIPIIFIHFVINKRVHLDYYVIDSFSTTFFDLVTMLKFHKFDYPMFPELTSLFILTFALSFFLSKKFLKSFFSTIFSFYGSFLIAGLSWFSLRESQPALIVIKSFFKPQKFYAMKWFIFVSILFFIFYLSFLSLFVVI